eukprot:NODE_25_length_35605_cov_0.353461.p13 type:complete len:210 gc:universal NODE_25_length_35605_cov_0.353461:28599-27970(-)
MSQMQTPKKVQFGQTNQLSLPSKRSAEQSELSIPEKLFGSEVKIPKADNRELDSVPNTPSKADFKLVKKEEIEEEDAPLFTGKHASLFLSENGAWTKKSKNGTVYLYEIEKKRLNKKKKSTKDSDGEVADKETAAKLHVIYREGSAMKTIMLNAVVLLENKVFQLPQQSKSVAFSVIVDGKLETVGILFKDETVAKELIEIVNANKING